MLGYTFVNTMPPRYRNTFSRKGTTALGAHSFELDLLCVGGRIGLDANSLYNQSTICSNSLVRLNLQTIQAAMVASCFLMRCI